MGRGVSSGGGESSLGYLFGSGETSKKAPAVEAQVQPANGGRPQNEVAASTTPIAASTTPTEKEIPAGVPGPLTNNYHRAEGQNCGNFITDRPSTKVHAAPGGGSSLDYLFGGPPPEGK